MPQASQLAFYRRAKSSILLAVPPTHSVYGKEIGMIKINGKIFEVEYFPDRTQRLKLMSAQGDKVTITWNYENDSELFTVISLAKGYKNIGKRIFLKMPYIPNARMDRVKSDSEVFTLKIFCELINQLGFENVSVLDAHSNVSLALLDNVHQMDIADIIKRAALDKLPKDTILYFPDEGSKKRHAEIFPDYKYVIGMKMRDWNTGEIQGLDIIANGVDIKEKTVLMVDDIISYGGSMYYSALKLKELGAKDIYAYATHTELSVLDENKGTLIKLLNDGTVKKLFTTDSIYNGNHKKIEVVDL